MAELRVDLVATLDGFGSSGAQAVPYCGYSGPGLSAWVDRQLAEDHVTVMGATTYRQLAALGAHGANPPRMAELEKIVFLTTLTPPLAWANTTVIDAPVESAMPSLKADGTLPMRTIGSVSLVRSLFRLNLVDRLRVMVFRTFHGALGEGPVFADLPGRRLHLIGSEVIDDRLVLVDYLVGEDS